jgi:hypothetical protein
MPGMDFALKIRRLGATMMRRTRSAGTLDYLRRNSA